VSIGLRVASQRHLLAVAHEAIGHHSRVRMLFISSPGVGHLMPILPVAIAAQAGGHEVLVGCGESLEPLVGRAGLRHVPIGPASLDEVRKGIPGLASADDPERTLLMYREAFGGIIASAIAGDVVSLVASWRPDIFVHEDLEMGSWIAGEELGIPHVTIQATAWRPHLRPQIVAHQNAIRAAHGLATDPDLAGKEGLRWFTTRPRSMREPDDSMPAQLGELRPEPDDRVGGDAGDVPAWLGATIDRPLVAVTLGTVNGHRLDLLHPIVDGLATLDVEVVVGLGADPSTLGHVPANVRVERYVPMSLLLPRSAVVVHHAGSGTTLAALAAGVPSAMVPIMADQPENAAAAARAGAALVLDTTRLTAAAVAETVQQLLDTPAFTDRARAVAAEIAGMPSPAAVVAEIEQLI
jgi:UDP:flavonoid glycosyltransferase YjiC (YdhE family)